jgi:hypothetical protein
VGSYRRFLHYKTFVPHEEVPAAVALLGRMLCVDDACTHARTRAPRVAVAEAEAGGGAVGAAEEGHSQAAVASPHGTPTSPHGILASAPAAVRAYTAFAAVCYVVHPYEDGNGRLGRLLASAELQRGGLGWCVDAEDKVMTVRALVDKIKKFL